MSREIWNEQRIKTTLAQLGEISGCEIDLTVVRGEGMYERGGEIFTVNEIEHTLTYSPDFCNHPDMPEEVVLCMLLYVYSGCCVRRQNSRMWSDVEEHAANLSEKTGIRLYGIYDFEQYIRPVRRRLYPDSLNGGCFFRVGDVLRHHYGYGDPCRYIITDIGPLTDEGIMITYTLRNKEYGDRVMTAEEAQMFKWFFVVEN